MKGSNRPRPIGDFPAEWQQGLLDALATPDVWHPMARGIPESNLRTKQNWLIGLKAGLKQFPAGHPELTKAALEGRISFSTVRIASWAGFDVLIKACPKRPSDIAREYLDAIARGERPAAPLD